MIHSDTCCGRKRALSNLFFLALVTMPVPSPNEVCAAAAFIAPRKFTLMAESDGRDWNSARRLCHSRNMTLATLDTDAFNFLSARIQVPQLSLPRYGRKPFWIGLYNEDTLGKYRWEGDCQPMTPYPAYWEAGQPQSKGSAFCVLADNQTLLFRAQNCSAKQHFLCQRRQESCSYSVTSPSCMLYISASHRQTAQGSANDCRGLCEKSLVESKPCWGFTMYTGGCVLYHQGAHPDCPLLYQTTGDAYFRTCFQLIYTEGPFEEPVQPVLSVTTGIITVPLVPACAQPSSGTTPSVTDKQTMQDMATESNTEVRTAFATSSDTAESITSWTLDTDWVTQGFTSTPQGPALSSASANSSFPKPVQARLPYVGCRCDISRHERKKILQEAEELRRELTLDRQSLSATWRKVRSAPDARPTSHRIAYVGMAFVMLVVLSIVLPDLTTLGNHVLHGVPRMAPRPRRRVCPIIE